MLLVATTGENAEGKRKFPQDNTDVQALRVISAYGCIYSVTGNGYLSSVYTRSGVYDWQQLSDDPASWPMGL